MYVTTCGISLLLKMPPLETKPIITLLMGASDSPVLTIRSTILEVRQEEGDMPQCRCNLTGGGGTRCGADVCS